MCINILDMPEEILLRIFCQMNKKDDIISISKTCTILNRICNDNKVWKSLCEKELGFIFSFYDNNITWIKYYFNLTNILNLIDINKRYGGCKHYKRECLIKTICCNKWYQCRYCHDSNENHLLEDNRFLTKEMLCCNCKTFQLVAQNCVNCDTIMANYYCSVCKLWDNERQIYHCDECGLCRVGDKQDHIHCNICSMCFLISADHKCVEGQGKDLCSVKDCKDKQPLFKSKQPLIESDCGHLIHSKCYFKMCGYGLVCLKCNH